MKAFVLTLAVMASVTFAQAQNNASANQPDMSNLQNQFNKMMSSSNSYTEYKRSYKVVEVSQLNAFWDNVQKTLRSQEKHFQQAGKNTEDELVQAKATIEEQAKQIKALRLENEQKEKAAQQNAYEVDNIIVLGIGLNKHVFMFLAFGIIIALLAAVGIVFSMYKNSKVVTDEKINAFLEIEQEFAEHKKTARERELKVKRELQTEINSKEELLKEMAALRTKVQV